MDLSVSYMTREAICEYLNQDEICGRTTFLFTKSDVKDIVFEITERCHSFANGVCELRLDSESVHYQSSEYLVRAICCTNSMELKDLYFDEDIALIDLSEISKDKLIVIIQESSIPDEI